MVGIGMITVAVRLAAMHDREALCRLYYEFHQFHAHGLPDRLLSLREPLETYECSDLYQALGGLIEDEDTAIFVADAAGHLVGFAEVYVRQDDPNPLKASYRHGHLQSLMVEEGFRRQGVGTRLLEAAQQWVKGKGAREVCVETWEFEEGPLRFYERNGYRTLRRMLIQEL